MLLFLLTLACGADKDASEGSGSAGSGDIENWSGGDFQFQTMAVDDGCLGGANEALFMPEGPATPHDFEYLIYIPDYGDLPEVYTIDLRKPFVEMPVRVDSDDGLTYQVRGSVMDDVELGSTAYGDCAVTMTVDADLTPVSGSTAEGSATITISDPRGDDGRCPVFDAQPCTVELELTATKE